MYPNTERVYFKGFVCNESTNRPLIAQPRVFPPRAQNLSHLCSSCIHILLQNSSILSRQQQASAEGTRCFWLVAVNCPQYPVGSSAVAGVSLYKSEACLFLSDWAFGLTSFLPLCLTEKICPPDLASGIVSERLDDKREDFSFIGTHSCAGTCVCFLYHLYPLFCINAQLAADDK